jgi:inner membrane protein
MAERSTKYAPLFLLLTFGALWLFDTLTGLRIHAMHYLLVGAGMCLFYLLELSLGEHVGFPAAYVAASASIVGLVGAYARAVLRSTLRGAALGGGIAALYAYLFALLSLEKYALLAGSLGLFVALAAVMYLTRWVDWDRLVRMDRSPSGPAAPQGVAGM